MTGPATTAPESRELAVDAPPPLPESSGAARLAPGLMAVGMLVAVVWLYRSGAQANPAFLVFPVLMLGSVAAATVSTRSRRRSGRIDADRTRYLGHLAAVRGEVVAAADAQRAAAALLHPGPEALWRRVGSAGMWRLRPGMVGFGTVRVGLGDGIPRVRLAVPRADGAEADPVTGTALRRLIDLHASVPAMPLVVDVLDADGPVGLDGDSRAVRGLLRAAICQLALSHSPEGLLIATAGAGFASPRGDWEWMKWLPHHRHPDSEGHLDYPDVRSAVAALERAGTGAGQRHALVVTDRSDDPAPVPPAVAVMRIGAGLPHRDGVRVHVSREELTVRTGTGHRSGAADRMPAGDALMFARRLAAHRPGGDSGAGGWLSLIGIDDPGRFDPESVWGGRSAQPSLRVPVGVRTAPGGVGQPLLLDIREAAAGGTGPHGLCVGATGSGKSELLRTIVLGMVARHAPEELNLVLVDFKGGATFHGLQRLRHVAAVITNLADEAALVERMRDALDGELHRRQAVLRDAGGFDSAAAYRAHRAQRSGLPGGEPMPALPTLLVIVDEFAELLAAHPDFAEMFAAIGRLGRSLGIHLLLASQRLEEGRLRGLESHLSYRICLKTLSAAESRLVLGVPDAHELPPVPGRGYLRTADGTLSGFHAAYVSGPAAPDRRAGDGPAVRPFHRTRAGGAQRPDPAGRGTTVMQAIVDRLAGRGDPARPIWLPPLGPPEPLRRLIDTPYDELTVPIGVVDRPFEQRREPLVVDLSGADGHIAVVGAPRSGKSTALATLLTALAATHEPNRIRCYGLDFGGGTLRSLAGIPHVAAVAGRSEPELAQRIIAEIESVLNRRENRSTSGSHEHVVLMIDGWAELCTGFDAGGDTHGLEARITAIAARGLSRGVHVALSAARWADIRPALRDRVGGRIELRLGDPTDSVIDRVAARAVPKDAAGRGITADGKHMRIAVPDLGAPPETPPDRLLAHTVGLLARRYRGQWAPALRLLPRTVGHPDLVAAAGDRDRPLLGLAERDLEPVAPDFGRHPQLLVIGENGCGKTATLRLLCREIARTRTPRQARLAVLDYRRGLLGAVPGAYLLGTGGHAVTPDAAAVMLSELYALLDSRRPGPDVTHEQLRERSWWSGPRLYLIVDDHDLVVAPVDNPLARLAEYLPYALDLGLRLIVARRSGGASRAMYDPVLSMMRDLGGAVLLMSADPDDGPLPGAPRPTRLPPGRAALIAGGEHQRLQVAWSAPC